MKEIDVEQGTLEWHMARLGKVTASRISDMLAKTKSGWGAGRHNYMDELATELLTGEPDTDGYKSVHMAAGTEHEPEARQAYELAYGVDVEKCGFVLHPTIGEAGCSPDGRVGDPGLVEIKCPLRATHNNTLKTRTIKREYRLQLQWQLACTGRQWCDYVSYLDTKRYPQRGLDDRRMRLCVLRIHRDNTLIAEIERSVIDFQKEVRAHYEELNRKFPSKTKPVLPVDVVTMAG